MQTAWAKRMCGVAMSGLVAACSKTTAPSGDGKAITVPAVAETPAAQSASAKAAPPSRPSASAMPVAETVAETDSDCCMGMNECKGQGGCAVPESHTCRGKNECKGKGGCRAHCPR